MGLGRIRSVRSLPPDITAPPIIRRVTEARRRVALGLGGALVAALAILTASAAVSARFPGDLAASEWVQSWRTPWLDSAMRAVSAAGEELAAALIVAAAAAALLLLRRRIEAGLILVATVVGFGVRIVLKAAVARPRPSADLVDVIEQGDGYSFPSGHALHYAVLVGFVLLVLPSIMGPGQRRRLSLAVLVVALLVVGASRIYLGVHWLSDVIAGYVFGGVVAVGAVYAGWQLKLRHRESRRE